MRQMSPWWLLCAMFCCGSGLAQQAEEQPYAERPFLGGFLQESRVVYPLRVGEWQAQGEHLYERPELGASVRFQQPAQADRWVDVYFYPAGLLSPERLDQDIAATVEGIRQHATGAGGYQHLEVGAVESFEIEIAGEGEGEEKRMLPARLVALRFEKDGKAYHSALVMLVKDLYYLKGRFSAEASALTMQQVRQQSQALISELARQTHLRSTGDCWMPAPIVRREGPLDGKAEGAVMSMSGAAGVSAVAFEDRIEALNPGSPEAILMQHLAMAATGRHVPGCLPVEDINPEVPEGWREIRFEYRAPEDAAPGAPERAGRRSRLG